MILKELIMAILGYGILGQIILSIIPGVSLYRVIGFWTGVLIAIGMTIHMKRSIEDALDLQEKGAQGHLRKTYAFRMLVVFAIIGLLYYFKIGSVILAFAGIMGLKVAAYLQPLIHKLLNQSENK